MPQSLRRNQLFIRLSTLALASLAAIGGDVVMAQGATPVYFYVRPAQPTTTDTIQVVIGPDFTVQPNSCLSLRLDSIDRSTGIIDTTLDYACPGGPGPDGVRALSLGTLPIGNYTIVINSGVEFGTPPPPTLLPFSVAAATVPTDSGPAAAILTLLLAIAGLARMLRARGIEGQC